MMVNEYYIGIDYSLEKFTVVISDCGKRPIAILQILQRISTKNKVKHYFLDIIHYKVSGQFETFKIEEVGNFSRLMSIDKIHFQRRLVIVVEEFARFLKDYPSEEIQKITMEGYSTFSKNNSFYTGEGYGSIKTLMHSMMGIDIDYFPAPKRPKKLVLGSGDLDKVAIMYLLEKEYGYTFLNDDMADAYLLSIFAFFAESQDQLPRIKF